MLGLGVAAGAFKQAIPFGRIWSFPKNIVIAQHPFDFQREWERSILRMIEIAPELAAEYVADIAFLHGDEWSIPAARPVARPLPS